MPCIQLSYCTQCIYRHANVIAPGVCLFVDFWCTYEFGKTTIPVLLMIVDSSCLSFMLWFNYDYWYAPSSCAMVYLLQGHCTRSQARSIAHARVTFFIPVRVILYYFEVYLCINVFDIMYNIMSLHYTTINAIINSRCAVKLIIFYIVMSKL